MSGNEDGTVLPWPRAFLPGSFDAPESNTENDSADADDGGEPAPAGSWPRLPEVAEMRPPLHLTVPGTPKLESGGDEGAFSLPPVADPSNPTAREVLATCMSLVTALGVAAAQGMWHRARHRQALADKARGKASAADHVSARTAKGPRGTGSSGGSQGSSLLRSLGGEKKGKGARAFSRKAGGGGGKSGMTGGGKSPRGPKSKSPKGSGPGRGKGSSGSKGIRASRGGKAGGTGRGMKSLKGGLGRLRKATGLTKPGGKASKTKPPKGGASKSAKGSKGSTPSTAGKGSKGSRGRKLSWKAAKSRPGPGGGKATTGRKRWAGRTATSSTKGKPGTASGTKAKAGATRSRKSRFGTWTWKSNPAWMKRWRTRRKSTPTAPTSAGSTGSSHTGSQAGGESWTRATPPPPPPGFGGMRPPPGADRTTRITVERVDEQARPAARALAVGQAALSAGPAEKPAARPAPPATSHQQGAPMAMPAMPVRANTQYRDADLTIGDVIEADADMAAEIVDGVSEARATADGCEVLMTKLEALHAKVVELKVPGVLAGMVLRLMDHTLTVKAKAEAIAENLPRAAEAISVAGSNAEARHKPLADAVRDAGHIRPADRDYHND